MQGSERQKPPLHPSREGSRLQSAAAPRSRVYRSAGGVGSHRFFENPPEIRVKGPWGQREAVCFAADPTPGANLRYPFSATRTRSGTERLRPAMSGQIPAAPTPYAKPATAYAEQHLGVYVQVGGRDSDRPRIKPLSAGGRHQR